MSQTTLTVELEENGTIVAIHGNELGLRAPLKAIGKLIVNTKAGACEHDHLKTHEWGGTELSSQPQGGTLVNHLKLYCWKTDDAG